MASALVFSCSRVAPAEHLSKGHRVLLDRGLQIQAFTFTGDSTGSGTFDIDRLKAANFTTVLRLWRGKNELLGPAPGYPWGRIINRLADPIFSPSSELEYADSLVSLQLLDEQDMNDSKVRAEAKKWFDEWRPKCPNIILYTNQAGAGSEAFSDANLTEYLSESKPDILSFDRYAFYRDDEPGHTSTALYEDMQRYRQWALRGHDQTSAQPIPYGMYLQAYQNDFHKYRCPSDSEMRWNQFAAWTFGYTFSIVFTYNWGQFGSQSLVGTSLFYGADERQPTAAYDQIAETNRQSVNLGPSLVRLLSKDVRFIPGSHPNKDKSDSDGDRNALPKQVIEGSPISGWGHDYITNVKVVNLSKKNQQNTTSGQQGLPGDVVLGFFKVLDESFDGPDSTDEAYVMVLNGLFDRDALASQTKQSIRLEFDFKNSGINSLQRLNRDTGRVEAVALNHSGGSKYYFDLVLDGGTADLFKFNTGAPFVGPQP
jgi:hypothetical protein